MEVNDKVRRGLLGSLAGGVAMLLGACGGGDGAGGADSGDPPLPVEPDGGIGGSMGVAARIVAIDRLAAQFEAFATAAGDTPATWQRLSDWAVSQPEFKAAGVGNRTLWAQFQDGRYVLFTDNWGTPRPQAAAQPVPAPIQRSEAKTGTAEVPGSADALVLAFSGADMQGAAATTARMRQALQARGWKVSSQTALTVENVRRAGTLGFLFITSHSGLFGPDDDTKDFAVMTDDVATDANDVRFKPDLDDGSLMYHRPRRVLEQLGLTETRPRYALTSRFVRKYMRFSPNSLVFLLSCNSGARQAAGFRRALTDQGAATIIGWDGNSNPTSYEMADLLIDRMTGANRFQPPAIPGRAFRFDDVWEFLGREGLLVTDNMQMLEPSPNAPVLRFGSGFQVLHPVVESLQAVGSRLIVRGEFGPTPGSVTVGGVSLPGQWRPDGKTLVVELPEFAHGEVLVIANGRTSNPRVLGSWRGKLTYLQEESQGCGPMFRTRTDIDLHVRADMHATRTEVDGPLKNLPFGLTPAPDTRATWTASGECFADGELVLRWSGGKTTDFNTELPHLYEDVAPPPPLRSMMTLRHDAVQQRFQVNVVFDGSNTYTVSSEGLPDTQRVLDVDSRLAGFENLTDDFTELLPWGTFLPMRGGTVQGASSRRASDEEPKTLTVSWPTMVPVPAYDDKIGR